MKKIILSILITIPNLLFGQDTEKIKDKENKETYYVLNSDMTTKHGTYQKFSYNNKLLIKGQYKEGVKDSIWECYDFEGRLTLKYDYSKNELLFYKPNDKLKDKQYKIVNGNNTSETALSRPPIYLGGEDFILSEIARNTNYPIDALDHGKSGKVYVTFTVDKFGKTSNHRAETPLGYGMDEESIRVLKLIPDNWLPALLNDRPVDVEIVFPIMFKLQ